MATHRHPIEVSLKAPPLWFVQKGVSVAGPMTTASLLRGVAFGQIPDDSLVRGHAWDHWRRASQIREVCALKKVQKREDERSVLRQESKPPTPDQEGSAFAKKFLRAAMTPAESLLLTLHAAVEATRAEVGLVHRFKTRRRAYVTSFTYGEGLEPLAGMALPENDPACKVAIDGIGVWGSQGIGLAQRAIMSRLSCAVAPGSGTAGAGPLGASRAGVGTALRGIAMIPIRVRGRTYAMLELGRADHPFRSGDKARLAGVRVVVEQRLAHEAWDPWDPWATTPSPAR